MSVVALSQLESSLRKATWELKGLVNTEHFKTHIFLRQFFKGLSDVHDEMHRAALVKFEGDGEAALFLESYRFQIPEVFNWADARKVVVMLVEISSRKGLII